MHGNQIDEEIKFTPVPTDDCESLTVPSSKTSYSKSSRDGLAGKLYTFLGFVACFSVAITLGIWIGSQDGSKSNLLYSPLMKDMNVKYEMVNYNGSLMYENIYRQNAGPEVDAAWEALGVDYRASIIPAKLSSQSGLRSSQVQVANKYGGGFPVNVEGLHHLHCLNLLRQSLYYNYNYYHALGKGAFQNDDTIVRYHVSHCLDILRQQLMCTVDVSVLGKVWWKPSDPQPFPDFNTQHKCRNFDEVRQWAEDHQGPEKLPVDFWKKPNPEDIYENMP